MSIERKVSRRQLLREAAALGAGLTLAGPILAACGPTPTPKVVEKVVEKPVEKVVKETVVVEKPVTKIVEKEVPAEKGMIILRSMGRVDSAGDSGRQFNQKFMQKYPNLVVRPVDVVYDELPTKGAAMFTAGNLPDVMYGAVKWYLQLANKGVYLDLTDLAKANYVEDKLDDIFPLALDNLRFEGRLFGLPESTMPGPRPLIKYNLDLLKAAGVPEPPLHWDIFNWAEAAIKLTDTSKGIFGTNYHSIGNYYDFDSFVNCWGDDVHTIKDKVGLGKKFNFVGDPKVKEATDYLLNLAKAHAMPLRGETIPGLDMFAGGKLATAIEGTYGIARLPAAVGGRFKYGLSIWKGPKGGPGTGLFIQPWCGGSQTKYPDWTWKLLVYQTSYEAGVWMVLNEIGLGANGRKSVWEDKEVLKKIPLHAEIAKMLLATNLSPFPHPWNVRFSELQDTWTNISSPLWYLEATYEKQASLIQQKCQEVMSLPRP